MSLRLALLLTALADVEAGRGIYTEGVLPSAQGAWSPRVRFGRRTERSRSDAAAPRGSLRLFPDSSE